MAEIRIGTRNRQSPFFDSTLAAGVTSFTIYNRMYLPTSYGDPAAEYRRLTEGVAMWDVGAERQVEIAGPDAESFASFLSARDLWSMKVGRARYAPLCDHQGRLINDPVALRIADDRFWFSLADSEALLWARGLAGANEFDVRVFEPDVSPLAIQGPAAESLAKDLFGSEFIDGLGFFHHCPAELDGIPVELCRSGWSKQGGFELFLTDGSQGDRLWNLVAEAGAPYDIGPGSPDHQERIESGLLSFGSDHDLETDPFEAGLGRFVSLDHERDFVGKQALLAARTKAAPRPIVNIRLDGQVVACTHPWEARIDGVAVGMVRNTVWSTKLDAWIGLAQLVMPHGEPGTAVEVVDPQARGVTAVVTDETFGTIRTK